MFEQPLYEFETVATPLKDGDLFHSYEIKSWALTSRISTILGISALLNIAALVFVAQTSVLTLKGCDSPLVGSVCKVLDTVYVGSLLFGTQRDVVDVEYERTNLGDADITYIDANMVSPPLTYPAGYFQIANPGEQFGVVDDSVDDLAFSTGIPGIPSGIPITRPSTGNSLFNTPPVVPKSNPNVIDGDLPSAGNPTGGIPAPILNRKKNRGGRVAPPTPNPDGSIPGIPGSGANTVAGNGTPEKDPNANTKVDPVNPVDPVDGAQEDKFGVYINKRPLKDQAKVTLEQIDEKKIQLANSFKVIIAGTLGLGKDKKTVILKDPKPLPVDKDFPNDPAMVKLAQDWILAIGDAGWLGYLDRLDDKKKVKSKRVVITLEQNDTAVKVIVRSELPSENEAKTASSGLNTLLGLASSQTKEDEQAFLKAASVSSDGNMVVLTFDLPKAQAQEMINRKLAEEQEKKAQQQAPSSDSLVRPKDSTAKK